MKYGQLHETKWLSRPAFINENKATKERLTFVFLITIHHGLVNVKSHLIEHKRCTNFYFLTSLIKKNTVPVYLFYSTKEENGDDEV